MKNRLRAAWHVLLGRPTAYRLTFHKGELRARGTVYAFESRFHP